MMEKRNKILGLQFLKGVTFILIFISHVFDVAFFGRGGCSFLMMSGLLMAYNYSDKIESVTLRECLKYWKKYLRITNCTCLQCV